MKKILPAVLAAVVVLFLVYFVGTGFLKNTSVYVQDFTVSDDGTAITLRIGVSSSMGYVRSASVHQQQGGKLYLDFTFAFGGLNGSIGAKDTFTLPLDEDTSVIAVRRDSDCYEEVLRKDDGGVWQRAVRDEAVVTKWFDCLHGDEMIWDGVRGYTIGDFPEITFRWYSERVEAVTESETVSLYTGMPVWSVYFCDLTGDGLPELCSTVSFGSGIVDNRVIVYDYANGESFELSDRETFDYELDLRDEKLIVEKRNYETQELLASGAPVIRDGTVQVDWEAAVEEILTEN